MKTNIREKTALLLVSDSVAIENARMLGNWAESIGVDSRALCRGDEISRFASK